MEKAVERLLGFFTHGRIIHRRHHKYSDDPLKDPHPVTPENAGYWRFFWHMIVNVESQLQQQFFELHGGDTPDSPLFLIGSADWMPRNLDKRIEVMVPVMHPKHQVWLNSMFDHTWADDVVRWELDAEGLWHRRGPERFDQGDAQGPHPAALPRPPSVPQVACKGCP